MSDPEEPLHKRLYASSVQAVYDAASQTVAHELIDSVQRRIGRSVNNRTIGLDIDRGQVRDRMAQTLADALDMIVDTNVRPGPTHVSVLLEGVPRWT